MIEFDRVVMNFREKEVLKDISFSVNDGEIFTLIGPSGSGKTTILRLIDMLERPTSGKILIDGTNVAETNDREKIRVRRKMGMVFQKPSSLRGSVYTNVAMGLQFRKVNADEISRRVSESLELAGLEGYEERRATSLSGGEMQRVAIARAITTKPKILLLDEPTANLDPVSAEKIERMITDLQNKFGITVVMSTHDMVQGQRLADRIAVLIDRQIGQIGTSKEIFYRPTNRAVAHMVGVENIFDGVVKENEAGLAAIDVNGVQIIAGSGASPNTQVTLYMRPEDITFYEKDSIRSSARNTFTGQIIEIVPIGPMVRLKVDIGVKLTAVITERSCEELDLELGKDTKLSFKASAIHVVEKRKDTD